MSIASVSRRRPAAWLGGMVAATVGVVALPGIAQAHVSVQPGEVEGGGFSVVSFRVPNERDDASTTKVQVVLPEDQPLGSVRTTPIPGWTIKTTTRQLEKPIEMFGERSEEHTSELQSRLHLVCRLLLEKKKKKEKKNKKDKKCKNIRAHTTTD